MYRQKAGDCLKLAAEANDVYVRTAMTELAAEFHDTADKIERGQILGQIFVTGITRTGKDKLD